MFSPPLSPRRPGETLTKSRGDSQRSRVVDTVLAHFSPILGAHVFSSTREAHMRVRSIHWPRAAGRRERARGLLPSRGQTSTNGRPRRAQTKTERGSPWGLWPVVGRQARGLRRGDRQSPPAPDLEWTFAVPPVHPLFILPLPPITCVYWPSPNTPPITAPNAVIALPVMHGAGGTPVPHRR